MAESLEVDDNSWYDNIVEWIEMNPSKSLIGGLILVFVAFGSFSVVSEDVQTPLDNPLDTNSSDQNVNSSEPVEFSGDNAHTIDGEITGLSDSRVREIVLKNGRGDVVGRDKVDPYRGAGTFSIYVAGFKDVKGLDISVRVVGFGEERISEWSDFKGSEPVVKLDGNGSEVDVDFRSVERSFN